MDADQARTYLLELPSVVETEQWGGIVFWVGDKALGGKMFAMVNLESGELPISWPVGQQRFAEMCERDGIRPAPYLARAFWVAAERWSALPASQWHQQLDAAHALVHAGLPARVRKQLELPPSELKKAVAERRKLLAAKAAAKSR